MCDSQPNDMTTQALLRLMRRRRSCRRYDAEKTVDRSLLETCVEAARLAPSACNAQPWHFIVVDDPALVATLRQDAKMPGIPHPWWEQVPVFVVLCARLSLVTHRVAPMISGIPYYLIDVGIAGEHFVLAATTLGLGTCWIGWFKAKAVRKILHLPRDLKIVSLLTVGWPAETGPDENDKEPSRKAMDEILSWNARLPKQPD